MRRKALIMAVLMLVLLTSMIYAEVDSFDQDLKVVAPEEITGEKFELDEKTVLAVEERARNCGNCNGLVITHEVGRGVLTMVDSTVCSQHSNGSLQIYEQRVYYEEVCSETCGYIHSFYTIEYEEKHVR